MAENDAKPDPKVRYIVQSRVFNAQHSGEWNNSIQMFKTLYEAIQFRDSFEMYAGQKKDLSDPLDALMSMLSGMMEKGGAKLEVRIIKRTLVDEIVEQAEVVKHCG